MDLRGEGSEVQFHEEGGESVSTDDNLSLGNGLSLLDVIGWDSFTFSEVGINEVLGDLERVLGPVVDVGVGGNRLFKWVFGHEVLGNFTVGVPVGIRVWKDWISSEFIDDGVPKGVEVLDTILGGEWE